MKPIQNKCAIFNCGIKSLKRENKLETQMTQMAIQKRLFSDLIVQKSRCERIVYAMAEKPTRLMRHKTPEPFAFKFLRTAFLFFCYLMPAPFPRLIKLKLVNLGREQS